MKNDCISRQAAIDEIGEWIEAFLENGHKESAADARLIQDGIIQLPSAQPEPNKGKWIEAYDPFNRISGRCSVCGWEAHLYEDDVVGMNYCPNCGAKMEDVVNEF